MNPPKKNRGGPSQLKKEEPLWLARQRKFTHNSHSWFFSVQCYQRHRFHKGHFWGRGRNRKAPTERGGPGDIFCKERDWRSWKERQVFQGILVSRNAEYFIGFLLKLFPTFSLLCMRKQNVLSRVTHNYLFPLHFFFIFGGAYTVFKRHLPNTATAISNNIRS